MRIKNVSADNLPPITNLQINDLGSIVIIAGANGSGKSRLKEAITQSFRNPSNPQLDFSLESTRKEEETYWGSSQLDVKREHDTSTFVNYMNSRIGGGYYVGSVISIDSQRSILNPQYPTLNLSVVDPDEAEVPPTWYLDPFSTKWNEIVSRIYQKVASRKLKLAKYGEDNPTSNFQDFLRSNPNPFTPYQEVFHRLLPDKTLDPIEPNQPRDFIYRLDTRQQLPFTSLSSGEQEVVKIAFYILSKKISHCVFLVDEPELHLHPTLSFRLVETLKELGGSTNQFIFFTHSADLISTYYSTGNVYFIDAEKTGANQAHKLSDLTESHSQLVELMSENLGLFAVGKKLVFVEGQQSSIDRLTYFSIAQKYFSDAHIIPMESVGNIIRLKDFSKEIENKIFGISFFMIRDRDGLTEEQVKDLEQGGRLICLKRRHIENYFLDEEILAKVAERFCLPAELYNPTTLVPKLKEVAQKYLNYSILLGVKEFTKLNQDFQIPNVKSLEAKTLDDIKKEYSQEISSALTKLNAVFSEASLNKIFQEEESKLNSALQNELWKTLFPGKIIFNQFCRAVLKDDPVRVRTAYIEIALKDKPEVFEDIIEIYQRFQKK